jgi:hypothetical protein
VKLTVQFLPETALDEAIQEGLLFRLYDNWDLPSDWEKIQDIEIEKLQRVASSYDQDNEFFVSDEIWPNNSKGTEVTLGIVDAQLLHKLTSHLLNSTTTCVLMGVYDDLLLEDDSQYLGRIALCLDEVIVEQSLEEWWKSTFGVEPLVLAFG